ncbi:carboxypeptidase regulatory-like domain-containing protein [candidate division KSB1 bacterium]|nr:carboxypeptidase regulatory-like domain-containing protein [candidate division KSB1 bacterium]
MIRLLVSIIFLIGLPVLGAPEWLAFDGETPPGPAQVLHLGSDYGTVRYSVSLGGMFVEEKQTPKGSFAEISLGDFFYTSDPGKAKLPVIITLVRIPWGAGVSVQVVDSTVKTFSLYDHGLNYPLIPVQKPVLEGEDKSIGKFAFDEEFYATEADYPSPRVEILDVSIFRAYRMARVAFYPIHYQPASRSLTVFTTATLEVQLSDSDPATTEAVSQRYYLPGFEAIANSFLLNPEAFGGAGIGQGKKPAYLLIVGDRFADDPKLPDFIHWKRQKGFGMDVKTVTELGESQHAIRNYIFNQYRYGEIPPAYVLLLGDMGDVPAFTGTTPGVTTDLPYSVMDGGEWIPDIALGRLLVSDPKELGTVLDRLIGYDQGIFSVVGGDDSYLNFYLDRWPPEAPAGRGIIRHSTELLGIICDSTWALSGDGEDEVARVKPGAPAFPGARGEGEVWMGQGMFGDWSPELLELGMAGLAAKMAVYARGLNRAHHYFEVYHLLSDPALPLLMGVPQKLFVDYCPVLPLGHSEYSLRVQSLSGPIPGAWVTLFGDGVWYGEGATDPLGRVSLALNPVPAEEGPLILSVVKNGYQAFIDTVMALVPTRVILNPDTVVVNQEARIAVTVRDTMGLPLPGTVIGVSGWGVAPVTDTTDASGLCSLSFLPLFGETLLITGRRPGENYDLFVDSIRVVGALDLLNAGIEVSTPDIGLDSALTHTWPGVITFFSEPPGATLFVKGCGVDTAFGGDTLRIAPPTTGELWAVLGLAGYRLYQKSIPVRPAFGSLTGRVRVMETGEPLPGMEVKLYPGGADPGLEPPWFSVLTDEDGRFVVERDLSVGIYGLYVSAFGFVPYYEPYLLKVDTNQVALVLTPAPKTRIWGFIRGKDSSRPLGGRLTIFRQDAQDEPYAVVEADSACDPSYQMELPYSSYLFRVESPHYISYLLTVILDTDSLRLDFELERMSGRVLVIEDKGGTGGQVSKILKDKTVITQAFTPPVPSAPLVMDDLKAYGYQVNGVSQFDSLGWDGYDLIVFSSGGALDPLPDSTLRDSLKSYVARGGKLLLEGGELGYKFLAYPGDWAFARKVLHVSDWGADEGGPLTLEFSQHPIATFPYVLPQSLGIAYQGWGDQDGNRPAADAYAVYTWGSDPDWGGVLVYDNNSHPASAQVVFFCFNYRAMDREIGAQLLVNTVNYLLSPEPGEPGTISGRVDLSGQDNNSGVVVNLVGTDLSAVTLTSGEFEIGGIYPGSYTLRASHPDFIPQIRSDVTVLQDQTTPDVEFELIRALVADYGGRADLAIPDNNLERVRSICRVDDDIQVAGVEVFLDIVHPWVSDLVVELTSPGGTTVRLHDRNGFNFPNLNLWYTWDSPLPGPGSLEDFVGEPAQGQWELFVADVALGDEGILNDWTLRVITTLPLVLIEEEGEEGGIPQATFLSQNFPNPFNKKTTITFGLSDKSWVSLRIYNVLGQEIATLVDREMEAGVKEVTWFANDQATGLYFYELQAGDFRSLKKMLYLK